ncbi:MAG: class I SAM-dependent methyltransferase [Fervidicoccus fontis]
MNNKGKRITFKIFDERTKEYDSWFDKQQKIYKSEVDLAKRFPCISPCLEIGVGTGRFAKPLNVEFGIDPSVSSLKISAEKGIEVIRATAEYLPLRDESFNTAYLIVTLCFVEDPNRTLLEAFRILKPEGKLVTCVVPLDSQWGSFYEEKKKKGETFFYKEAVFFTKKEIKEMISNAGFILEKFGSVLHYPPNSSPVPEEPSFNENGSFVCYEAKKADSLKSEENFDLHFL